MGAPASKFGQEISQEEPTKGSLPSTPILTPKTFKLADLDPRSPSENIVRTPIEILLTKKPLTSDNVDLSLSEDSDECTKKIYSPCVKLKNIDPRSPTLDFVRTPVVVPEDEISLPLKLHNKNLDNVRKSLLLSPITKHAKDKSSEKATPPKLLESNIIWFKPIDNKCMSSVGLLETNLDFIETNLDKVQPNGVEENTEHGNSSNVFKDVIETTASAIGCDPTMPNAIIEECSPSRNGQNIHLNNPALEKADVLETMEAIANSTGLDNENGFKITPYLELPNLDGQKLINKINTKTDSQSSKSENVKDFDTKLTNLIYEDKEKSPTVAKNKKVDDGKSRTPLSTRNANVNIARGFSKLKVHDRPHKKNKDSSKIPVFQNKKGRGKVPLRQCENTPPTSFNDRKLGKQQWDANNTLVI